jgi:hypothetical protein
VLLQLLQLEPLLLELLGQPLLSLTLEAARQQLSILQFLVGTLVPLVPKVTLEKLAHLGRLQLLQWALQQRAQLAQVQRSQTLVLAQLLHSTLRFLVAIQAQPVQLELLPHLLSALRQQVQQGQMLLSQIQGLPQLLYSISQFQLEQQGPPVQLELLERQGPQGQVSLLVALRVRYYSK